MNGNRFDFLEIPGATSSEPADLTVGDGTPPPAPDRRMDLDGYPLAQVVDTDLRGYRAFLEMQREDALATSLETMASGEDVAYELRAVEVFGGKGIRAGQFNFPGGLAVDSQGVLYVADSYNHRVQRITPDGGVSIVGGRGQARTQFLSPQGVAVDGADCFYVVEQGNHRVQKYTPSGNLELVLEAAGHSAGELYRPTGIAVSQDGDIYVADTGNCRIQRFDKQGEFVSIIGVGPGAGVLTTPQAVAVDRGDNVYVLDTFGHRLVRYDPTGRFLDQFGGNAAPGPSGDKKARFLEPRAVSVDPSGLIYVADNGETLYDGNISRGRLQVVDPRSAKALISVDKLGRNLGCLFRPGGVAVTVPEPMVDGARGVARGDVYVADTMNHRILKFAWTTLK